MIFLKLGKTKWIRLNIDKRAIMGRKKKYLTEEEKKESLNQNAKNWYQRNKDNPDFILRRKWYQTKYYDNLNISREDFIREYNADYALYMRSIRTGRLARKIAKNKERVKYLQDCITRDEKRLYEVTERFKHLEKNGSYEQH